MKRGYLFATCILILLIVPSIFAASQEINIRSIKNHSISIIVLASGETYNRLEGFIKNTGNGNLTFTGSYSVNEIDIIATLFRKDGSRLTEKFTNLKVGEPVTINLIPGDVKLITASELAAIAAESTATLNISTLPINETLTPVQTNTPSQPIPAETTSNPETKKSSSFFTGFAVQNISSSLKPAMVYFIIAIIVIVLILVLLWIFLRIHKRKSNQNFKVVKYSEMMPSYESKESSESSELSVAEEKIKSAQEELEKIKNRQKSIFEAERKVQEDRKELNRLRHDFNPNSY